MSQNQAAFVARAAAGGLAPLNLDDTGRLLTASAPTAGGEYETVAASQTKQVLGATGGAGDVIASLIIVPATTSPGAVTLFDGAGTGIVLFAGGATSVPSLTPITVPLNLTSLDGAWSVSTGANVSVLATGNFKA